MIKDRKLNLFGIGSAGDTIVSVAYNTYFTLFLTDAAKLPLHYVALIGFLGGTFDWISSIAAGGIITASKSTMLGKYRPWLMIASPACVIFAFLIFTIIPNNMLLTSIVILVCYILAGFSWNIATAVNVTFVKILSNDKSSSNRLSSQRVMGINLGRLFGSYVTPLILIRAMNLGQANAYRVTVLIIGSLSILLNLVHLYITKKYDTPVKTAQIEQSKNLALKEIISGLRASPQIITVLIIDMASNVCQILLPGIGVYYFKYVAEDFSLVAIYSLAISVAGLAGVTLIRFFGSKISSKKALIFLYSAVVILLLFCRFAGSNPGAFIVVSAAVNFFAASTQPYEINLYMNSVIESEYKTGADNSGFILGLSNLPQKISIMLYNSLVPILLSVIGFEANVQASVQIKNAIVNLYTFVPAGFAVISTICLIFIYKINDSDIEKMRSSMQNEAD